MAPRLEFRVFCGILDPEKNEISQIIYFILDCKTPASQAAKREQADYPDALSPPVQAENTQPSESFLAQRPFHIYGNTFRLMALL